MDDKSRARNYYAAAVSLFQDPSVDDCKRAIELLNKAVGFYPDFSEVSIFREDVWHYLLKSLDPGDNNGTYDEYRKSPAWKVKRDAVIQRDGGQCVCGAEATEMHHKTYKNIGKEPVSDLVVLCEAYHEKVHQPHVPSDHQSTTGTLPHIRKRRTELGLSQTQVAKELGLSDGTSVGDWENERAKIPRKHHAKLLAILELTPFHHGLTDFNKKWNKVLKTFRKDAFRC